MLCSVGLKAYSVFAAFLDNGFLHHGNEPLVCSMIETSQPPLTSWGQSRTRTECSSNPLLVGVM